MSQNYNNNSPAHLASLLSATRPAKLQHVPAMGAFAAIGQLTGLAHPATLLARPLVNIFVALVNLIGKKRLEYVVHQTGGRRLAPGIRTLLQVLKNK